MKQDKALQDVAGLLEKGFTTSLVPQFMLDGNGRILLASAGAAALLGQPANDLAGKAISHFFADCPDLTQMRKSGPAKGLPVELEVRRHGGNLVPVEVYCNIFETRPDQVNCLLVIHDISNTKFLDQQRAARLAKLSLLNQVGEALYGAHLTLDQVLQAVLICVTAGQGLGFNRAFLLLVNEQNQSLEGEMAIGPSNREEAARIWQDLEGQRVDLYEMMTSYDRSIPQTDAAVNEIVRQMRVRLDDGEHLLIRAMFKGQAIRVGPNDTTHGADTIRHWLGCNAFAVAPLVTRRGPRGVIIADNAIAGGEISSLDLEILQLFANSSASAIENSRLYQELEKRLVELRKVYQQQRKDQETLLRMERLSVMGETSAIVAHELRNPLVAIGGFARTLLRSLDRSDPNHRFAEIITDEVGRLERIIHDLLDFIRPQKLLRKSVLGDELVSETVHRYEEKMAEQGIVLAVELGAPSLLVQVNPGEIQQVLQNLVVNAMQAQPDGGRILVRTRVLEGGLQVEVLDDGPGYEEELDEKIFTPFFTTKASGSGLGLTICSQIVKAHGGVLNARPLEEGGAAFSFILPLPKSPLGSEEITKD